MNEQISSSSHEIKIIDRSLTTITGVTKLVSFDNTEFVLETTMGPLHIKGNNLELLSLNTAESILKIKGKINGYNYIEKIGKKSEESIFTKLFK